MTAEMSDDRIDDMSGLRTADLETWMRKSLMVDRDESHVWVRIGEHYEDPIAAYIDDDGDLIIQLSVPEGWENGETPVTDPMPKLPPLEAARHIPGGRVWEFEHDGNKFEIESLNGSSTVRLYQLLPYPQKPGETIRSQVTYRKTQGRSAKAVAEELRALIVDGGESER